MNRIAMVRAQTVLLFIVALLAGCDERSAVTATPSPVPPEVSTLAPTPTLAATETAGSPATSTADATGVATATAEASPTTAQPQGVEERISFAPGATSATVENAVVSGTRDRYLVEAVAGQTMLVEISAVEDNAELQVLAPDGQELSTEATGEGEAWEASLPQSGDYVIVVGPTRGNATYRLQVTIPPLETPEPTRISFEPGMAATLVEGHLEAGERALYVLEAVEDQMMTASVTSESDAVIMGVQGEDGTVFLPLEAQGSGLRIVALPATMDYFVELVASGGATDFQLDVGASPLAGLPERLELVAGETATVSGTLAPGGDLANYLVLLEVGQMVTVDALPAEAPLNVFLQSEDGVDFFFATEGRLEETIPRTLDYLLTVSTPNAAGETDYELRITNN